MFEPHLLELQAEHDAIRDMGMGNPVDVIDKTASMDQDQYTIYKNSYDNAVEYLHNQKLASQDEVGLKMASEFVKAVYNPVFMIKLKEACQKWEEEQKLNVDKSF